MRLLPTFSACLFLLVSTALATHTNIVVILTDDLGYGDLSCYGQTKYRTPRLDQMAREGVRLTNFQTPMPYCAPTRTSLMTGRYPLRAGLSGNPVPAGDVMEKKLDHVGLPLSEMTLPNLLRQNGYRTGMVGKWHLGHQPQFLPTRRGFDDYLGILYSNDMNPVELWDNEKKVEFPLVQATLTRRLTDRAISFIRKNNNTPFFLYVAHPMPHKPLAVSPEFYKKSGTGLYGDVITELDFEIGRLLDTLKELKLEENTLVILTSDNGPWYGGSAGGLRGMKGRSWEGGTRVPFIARWTGTLPSGAVREVPAITMDIFATALAVSGTPSPAGRKIDGKNLMPVLMGQVTPHHEHLFSFRNENLGAVRSGKWKLILGSPGPQPEKNWQPGDPYTDPRRPDGVYLLAPYEQPHPSSYPGFLTGDRVEELGLFDLDADPSEQKDLSKSNPEITSKLKGVAEIFLNEIRSDPTRSIPVNKP